MDHTFVRSQPAQLRIVCQLPRHLAEVRHQFFDMTTYKLFPQHLDRIAYQLVSIAQRQRYAGTKFSFVSCDQRRGKGVLGAGVYGIAAGAIGKGEANVSAFDRDDSLIVHIVAKKLLSRESEFRLY